MKPQAFKTKGCRCANDRWAGPSAGALLALMCCASAAKGSRRQGVTGHATYRCSFNRIRARVHVRRRRVPPALTASQTAGLSDEAIGTIGGASHLPLRHLRRRAVVDRCVADARSGATVPPATALAVGLKVDVEALPPEIIAALQAGQVDLTNPAVTVELLRLNAVVGVQGKVNDLGQLTSVGITCALCHSSVDNSFAPGIGKRLDGWANIDLNVGAIVASRRRWMRPPRRSSTPGARANMIPATMRSTARTSCR